MHVVVNAIPIRPGGGLTVLLGLLRGLRLAEAGCRLTVIASDDATLRAVATAGDARAEPVLTGAGPIRTYVWQNFLLGGFLRRNAGDALLTFNHHLRGVACPQVVYHLNLRRFCREHRSWHPWRVWQEGLRDQDARRALRWADANVFESCFLRDAAAGCATRPIRNARVIYAGMAEELIALSEHAPTGEASAGSRRLVAITSPLPHKDNPTLLRALAALVARAPGEDWRLDIAGGTDPEAWRPTRALAQSLGVLDRVAWHGFVGQERLTELLRSALCLVSTSQLESFAMVATEAMARSCPPIVANRAAMPESVGDAGLLAQAGSPESFADAVMSLAFDPKLRAELARRGRRHIQGFRWARCGEQFRDLLREVTARPAAGGDARRAANAARAA